MSDFVYGMTILKLPTTLGAIIAMMIRLIPGMLTDLRRVKDAQTSRGMEMEKVNIVTKVARYIYLILPIMSLTFRRIDTLSRTVEVRGLRKTPRWVYKQPKLKRRDYAIIITCIIVCAVTIVLYTFYPEYIMDYADYWRGRGMAVT
jgi:energy-coupling factor transport system permease protein